MVAARISAVARGTRVAVRARATRDLLLQRPSIWRATRDLLLQIVDLPPHRARAHAFGVLRPLRAAQCLFDLGAEAIQPHPERPPVGEAAPAEFVHETSVTIIAPGSGAVLSFDPPLMDFGTLE